MGPMKNATTTAFMGAAATFTMNAVATMTHP
jgi:hypothetical protein